MDEFSRMYVHHQGALERYVHLRISQRQDAEDVLQEILIAACQRFHTLTSPDSFKPWLLAIARHKCADWLRRKYRSGETLMPEALLSAAVLPRFAAHRDSPVMEAMARLSPADRQLLHLRYWQERPVADIARLLAIPPGTVKSRLHAARARFRRAYPGPIPTNEQGGTPMRSIMPARLPDYEILPSPLPPFSCRWEELMGWFIVPLLGEKLSWAMYDFPDRLRTEEDCLTVTGRAEVHGVEGVEISVETLNPMACNAVDQSGYVQRSFVAQLTDTHCRILSETHTQDGVKRLYTFLDGDAFLGNWGFGEDNCGNETHLHQKGDIRREGSTVATLDKKFLLDVVGRYTVTIGGRTYDTICVMDVETYSDTVSEQFIDQNGRTVLWRRFNRDDWQYERYGRTWREMLPGAETLTVNGRIYVHWYDCITSYIL